MTPDSLMNSIKNEDLMVINNCLESIRTLKLFIANCQERMVKFERIYDLNSAAEIKYGEMKNAEETLINVKKLLFKTIASSAFNVIDRL